MIENLKRTFNEMKKVSKAPFWSELITEIIEMVSTDRKEQEEIIKNVFFYLDDIFASRFPTYDKFFTEQKPTIENLIAAYYSVDITDFLKAWTFAISTFNYAKAIENEKKKFHPGYA